MLKERVDDPATDIVALYGALDAQVQDRAISPSPPGRRKVVLATSIAETSLTIEGVRVVIDCGLARVPRFEPGVGLTRLETVRVSRAAADQRRGRAGRTEPGVCYRLWNEPQTASLEALRAAGNPRPPICRRFALDLAQWGVSDPATLAFLDPPPQAAYTEARKLLTELSGARRRRPHHRRRPQRCARCRCRRGWRAWWSMRRAKARANAPPISPCMVTERGLGGNDVDVTHRLDQFRRDRSRRADEARRMAKRWADEAGNRSNDGEASVGALLALAYPDRVAKGRGGGQGGFLLANGRGATLDPALSLAREPFIVAAELSGTAAQARILLAAPISLARDRAAVRRSHRPA